MLGTILSDLGTILTYIMAGFGLAILGIIVVEKPEHKKHHLLTKIILFLIAPLYLTIYLFGKAFDKIPKKLQYLLIIILNVFIFIFILSILPYTGLIILYLITTIALVAILCIPDAICDETIQKWRPQHAKLLWQTFSLWPAILIIYICIGIDILLQRLVNEELPAPELVRHKVKKSLQQLVDDKIITDFTIIHDRQNIHEITIIPINVNEIITIKVLKERNSK